MTWQTGGSGDYVGMGTSLSSGGAAVDLSGFTGITFEATGNTTYTVSVTMDDIRF